MLKQTLNITNNSIWHSFAVIQNLLRWNPNGFNPLSVKKLVSSFIPHWPVTHVMRYSIDLNCQFCDRAIKVENIWSNRMLAAKFDTHRFLSKKSPQHHFWL